MQNDTDLDSPTDSQFRVIVQILDSARLIRAYTDIRAHSVGSTRTHLAILARLSHQPGLTQSELGDILEIKPITLTRLIDRLSSQGLVERQPHPTDKRAHCLTITPSGRIAIEAYLPAFAELADDLLAGIDADSLATFRTVLIAIKGNVETRLAEQSVGHGRVKLAGGER